MGVVNTGLVITIIYNSLWLTEIGGECFGYDLNKKLVILISNKTGVYGVD
jgi:hypothetical protein